MSYHHTCPGCAVDQTRRRHDEPDRGTLCERCSWSGALAYVVRLFWQGVCEQDAAGFDEQATRCDTDARNLRSIRAQKPEYEKAAALHDWRATKSRARAAELRAWASGVMSKPICDVRT